MRKRPDCTAEVPSQEKVHRAVHALSQPMMTVSLALTVATMAPGTAERDQALETAQAECTRAMQAIEDLRVVLGLGWERSDAGPTGQEAVQECSGMQVPA